MLMTIVQDADTYHPVNEGDARDSIRGTPLRILHETVDYEDNILEFSLNALCRLFQFFAPFSEDFDAFFNPFNDM